MGSVPGLGRSFGKGNGNPLQYSCLENPTDREAWWAAVHEVTRVRCNLAIKYQTYIHIYIYVCFHLLYLSHFAIHLKLTQYGIPIYIKNFFKTQQQTNGHAKLWGIMHKAINAGSKTNHWAATGHLGLTLNLDVDGVRHDLFTVYFHLTDVWPIVWTLHTGYAWERNTKIFHWWPFEFLLQESTFSNFFVFHCDDYPCMSTWLGRGTSRFGQSLL